MFELPDIQADNVIDNKKIILKDELLKILPKTSDELPGVVWDVNRYGYDIKYKKDYRKRHNLLNQEDEITLEKNGQDSRSE